MKRALLVAALALAAMTPLLAASPTPAPKATHKAVAHKAAACVKARDTGEQIEAIFSGLKVCNMRVADDRKAVCAPGPTAAQMALTGAAFDKMMNAWMNTIMTESKACSAKRTAEQQVWESHRCDREIDDGEAPLGTECNPVHVIVEPTAAP